MAIDSNPRFVKVRAEFKSKLMATTSKSHKYVYLFGNKKADGDGSMKPLLGGKGANLAEMTRIGLPVPPGFTITTEGCTYYYAHKRSYPKELRAQVKAGVANTEKILGNKFGDLEKPLLVAVRSGARESMPGMMDTILNLGLNDQTVAGPRQRQQQPALRLGLLPPLHPNVRRRRHGRAKETRRRPRAL